MRKEPETLRAARYRSDSRSCSPGANESVGQSSQPQPSRDRSRSPSTRLPPREWSGCSSSLPNPRRSSVARRTGWSWSGSRPPIAGVGEHSTPLNSTSPGCELVSARSWDCRMVVVVHPDLKLSGETICRFSGHAMRFPSSRPRTVDVGWRRTHQPQRVCVPKGK